MNRSIGILLTALMLCFSLWASDEGKCGELTAKLRGEVEEVARMVVEHARVAAIPDQRVMADLLSSEIDEKTSAIVRSGLPFPELEVHLRIAVEGMQKNAPPSDVVQAPKVSAGEDLARINRERIRERVEVGLNNIEKQLMASPISELGKTLKWVREIEETREAIRMVVLGNHSLSLRDLSLSPAMQAILSKEGLKWQLRTLFEDRKLDFDILSSLPSVPYELADRLFLSSLQLHVPGKTKLTWDILDRLIRNNRYELLKNLISTGIEFDSDQFQWIFSARDKRAFVLLYDSKINPSLAEGCLHEALRHPNLASFQELKAAGFNFRGLSLLKRLEYELMRTIEHDTTRVRVESALWWEPFYRLATLLGWFKYGDEWIWVNRFRPLPGIFNRYKHNAEIKRWQELYEFLVQEGAQ